MKSQKSTSSILPSSTRKPAKLKIAPVELAVVACHLARNDGLHPSAVLHDAYALLNSAAEFLARPEHTKLDHERAAKVAFAKLNDQVGYVEAAIELGYKSRQGLDAALKRWIDSGHDRPMLDDNGAKQNEGRMARILRTKNPTGFDLVWLKGIKDAEVKRVPLDDGDVISAVRRKSLTYPELFQTVNQKQRVTHVALKAAIDRLIAADEIALDTPSLRYSPRPSPP